MSNSIDALSSKALNRAAALKARIEKLTRDLESILGGTVAVATLGASAPKVRKGRKRKMSKPARARMAEAARKRWAKAKAAGKNRL